jgi:molybdopterin-guanine dinucleotide biosynthesis protein A
MIGAIILSGGEGSRLGYREKGLMPFGGESLIARKVRQVAERFPQTVIVTNRSHLYERLSPGVRIVVDDKPYLGPLRGLYCGLRAADCEMNFVCAVDMPFLSQGLLEGFENHLSTHDVVIGRVRGYAEPLFGFYSKRVLPIISALLHDPRSSLKAVAESATTRYVEEDEIRAHDPRLLSFENINTEEDLERCLGYCHDK